MAGLCEWYSYRFTFRRNSWNVIDPQSLCVTTEVINAFDQSLEVALRGIEAARGLDIVEVYLREEQRVRCESESPTYES